MTIQSRALLRKLRKAQISEGGSVFIDFDAVTASTCHDANSPCKCVSLKHFKDSIRSILVYLDQLGYISYNGCDDVVVLHKGWHPSQDLTFAFCRFMLKSVLVPIVVSAATTLLTVWISALFK